MADKKSPDQSSLEGSQHAKEAEAQVCSSSWNSSIPNWLTVEERFRIIRSIGEECIKDDELKLLLSKKPEPICYDGFEPSGRMHIAQGIMKTINVNKLTSSGCKVKILIADWFAKLNKKMGGDLKKIQIIGEYMIEIWKATGMNLDRVEFVWASKEIISRADEYLPLVFDIAEKNNVPRIMRCCQIMGRSEQDDLSTSQLFYPCMQCADVFFLKADICQLGMDQRKVNVLAREYCDDIKRKNKPIILSHHMLPGFQQGQEKMSKSDPSSSIFMEDEEADVNVKIKKAYCPPKIVNGNPCIEYVQYIIFPWFGEFEVEGHEENGANKIFKNFEELVVDYETEKLHPEDLKRALSKALNKILQPVRDHFKFDSKAKDLLTRVKVNLQAKEAEAEVEQASSSSSESSIPNSLAVEERFKIIRSVGEECTQEDELMLLLSKKPEPICYDGFEPSGRMHIAEGIMKTINVNKLTSAGCKVKIWIADWFAKLNKKMGGDLKKIQNIGEYMIEIWKATGMNHDRVEFLWASKEIISKADEYLPLVFDIAEKNKIPRIMRCCQIMRCSEKDELSTSQLFYPCMQCADVFFLKADICQLGMDQLEVNMLAREYCDSIKKKDKPIILSHHMLPGLQQGQEKMSKSDPSSCIFMEDEEAEVNVKIKKAYCPQKIVEGNPCLEYVNYIIFPWFGEFEVERRQENGGNKIFKSFEEVVIDYQSEKLHPADLKPALSKALNKILQPVRDHFKSDPRAKDLLKKIKAYKTK